MVVATRPSVVALVERFVRASAKSQGPSTRPNIAITFDDGPHPMWTPKVLDALDVAKAKATFFVVGRNVAAHPDLVKETRRRGHEIGTHLFSHDRNTVNDDGRFADEVKQSRDILEALLGEPLRWLRFPYGAPGKQRPNAIRRQFGLETAHWTYSSHDGMLTRPKDILDRVSAGMRPGAILLMHDALADEGSLPSSYVAARDATVQALPQVGDLLAARGLAAVTLSELFAAPAGF